jgi:predicted DCC family thiol-disulfide oxidoreductase YuxK
MERQASTTMGALATERTSGAGKHLFLYDGVCGLCNRVNRFVLRYDSAGQFDFASLQSETARSILQRFGKHAEDLDTFYVVTDYRRPSAALLSKARSALFVARTLGWPWRALTVLGLLPTPLLDFFYDLAARHRYQLFGRYDSCPLPTVEHRKRFIDV